MRVAQENARKHEKGYRKTLVLLKLAHSGTPTAANRADRALIQSLEERLNDANQQHR